MRDLIVSIVLLSGCSLLLSGCSFLLNEGGDGSSIDASVEDAGGGGDAPDDASAAWMPWINHGPPGVDDEVSVQDTCTLTLQDGFGSDCGLSTYRNGPTPTIDVGQLTIESGVVLTIEADGPFAIVANQITIDGTLIIVPLPTVAGPIDCSFTDTVMPNQGGGGGGGGGVGGNGGGSNGQLFGPLGGSMQTRPDRELKVGCQGQAVGSVVGGLGGGAVHLQATTSIVIEGSVFAGGGGGNGGLINPVMGGTGGGAGGLIVLDSPRVTVTADGNSSVYQVAANGGGGGGGAGVDLAGTPNIGLVGSLGDGAGGAAGSPGADDGGIGGNGASLISEDRAGGQPSSTEGAGGGGGGGLGFIVVNTLDNQVDSDAMSPLPE